MDLVSTPSPNGENRLVWLDLEMTGLNPESDVILEIATLVSDRELNVLAEGPVFAVRHGQDVLDRMDDWNKSHHGKSGLVARVLASNVDTAEAEAKTLDFLQSWAKAGTAVLSGNSVWQDRRFLARYMPRLERFFHYRILDVSSLKVLAQSWYPEVPPFQKSEAHVALSDVRESVAELRHFRDTIFKPRQTPG